MRFALILFLAMVASVRGADLINPTNRINWVYGLTTGVKVPFADSGVVSNVVDHGADPTGATDSSADIQAVINNMPAFGTVLIPECAAGQVYDCSPTGLTCHRSNIRIKGAGSNSVIFGPISKTRSISGGYVFYSTNWTSRGATNLILTSIQDQFASTIIPGDAFIVSSRWNASNELFQVIGSKGASNSPHQLVYCHAISGNTVTISSPLMFDFTNGCKLTTRSLTGTAGFQPHSNIVFETLTFTLTNNGATDSAGAMFYVESMKNATITNCNFMYANNYQVYLSDVADCDFVGNQVRHGLPGGSHAGILLSEVTGVLFENNIFADGLSPAIQYFGGGIGNVFFANLFTNNASDMIQHNTHPIMDLWEHNHFCGVWMHDGYYGSASHFTAARNKYGGATTGGSIHIKRFGTHFQMVGNIVGSTNFNMVYEEEENGSTSPYPVWDMGKPNIGNADFTGISPPISWSWPGSSYVVTDNVLTTNYDNCRVRLTSDQGPTNRIYGTFTTNTVSRKNWPDQYTGYGVKFQDQSNTNLYYSADSDILILTNAGDHLVLNQHVTVSNGWLVCIGSSDGYQQLQQTNKSTHNINGNLMNTNGIGIDNPVLVWVGAPITIPDSYWKTSEPGYWQTTRAGRRWPAVDVNSSPAYVVIPAEDRFNGYSDGGGEPAFTITGRIAPGRVSAGGAGE